MTVYANNILQQVQTYQRASLGLLQNLCCLVSNANTRFKDFASIETNLGSAVTFDLPPRATVSNGLVASWQAAVQRVQTLTCDQAANASFSATAQQRIFNLEKGEDEYIKVFGKSFMTELANQIEGNLALNATSSVPVMTVDANGQSIPTGALHTESGPYRFFGDGSTPLTSFNQIAQMMMLFDNYGTALGEKKIFLPDVVYPSIIGSGLNQFSPKRNDETSMSWDIGSYGTPESRYLKSNLLPLHVAGTIGDAATTLTLVSTNDPTGQNVTQLTFSGAGTDANAIKSGDLFSFNDGVSGKPNMRYLTFVGHKVSANKVQMRVTADAASSGGSVTISIYPALNWAGGANQNLNNPLQAGMQVTVLPSHRAGLVVGGDAFYVAMPRLPMEDPYFCSNEIDMETGCSIRLTKGSVLGQNQNGLIYDATWGSVAVPEYCMRIIIPLSQGL